MRLASYLKKPDQSLQPTEIALDTKCDLGTWLVGEGMRFSSRQEFAKLKAEHARFHKATAKVVRRANTGGVVTQELLLGSKSEFVAASTAVVQALMTMKSKA
jgi:methyl-accepting chemotaxis protein